MLDNDSSSTCFANMKLEKNKATKNKNLKVLMLNKGQLFNELVHGCYASFYEQQTSHFHNEPSEMKPIIHSNKNPFCWLFFFDPKCQQDL
jgi:hypothetical protein